MVVPDVEEANISFNVIVDDSERMTKKLKLDKMFLKKEAKIECFQKKCLALDEFFYVYFLRISYAFRCFTF